MKKISAFLVGAGLIASSVLAADPVTSVNIVGYQTVTCPKGQFVMVSTAFKSIEGKALKSADVFSSQLPIGTYIYAFNSVSNAYDTDSRNFSAWSSNITYRGGMGFWIKVPASAASNEYNVVMAGEVPMEPSVTNSVYPAFNMLGAPYTASVAWTNTSLFKNSVIGDYLYMWTGSNYVTYSKNFAGWGPATNLVLTPEMGFWYKRNSGSITNIVDVRPYNP